jgi:hypothetical protein
LTNQSHFRAGQLPREQGIHIFLLHDCREFKRAGINQQSEMVSARHPATDKRVDAWRHPHPIVPGVNRQRRFIGA